MRHSTNWKKSVTWLMVAAVSAIGTTPAWAAKPCVTGGASAKVINVEVPEGGLPEFVDDECGGMKGKGAVCNDINQAKPNMRFKLDDKSVDGWEFVRVELSGDGTTWPGTLPLGVYSDFTFDSDEGLYSGQPAVEFIGMGKDDIRVDNNNCHNFTVHYRLVLKNSDGNFYRLHPVIENGGTEEP